MVQQVLDNFLQLIFPNHTGLHQQERKRIKSKFSIFGLYGHYWNRLTIMRDMGLLKIPWYFLVPESTVNQIYYEIVYLPLRYFYPQ